MLTVIVGGTYQAAREKLKSLCDGAKITEHDFTAEATVDGRRMIAMGGSAEDVCWLRGLGFDIKEIIVIESGLISEEMEKRINHMRSAIRLGR